MKSFSEAKEISKNNFARYLVLNEFLKVMELEKVKKSLNIIVVGGDPLREPEVAALKALNYEIEVTTVGLGDSDIICDLNILNPELNAISYNSDLVLCSQVLEHVWNHENFFKNLRYMVDTESYLWLACPAVNRPHGSPEFYSPGFTHEYLAKNLHNKGFKILLASSLGSMRLYVGSLFFNLWLSVSEHESPLKEIQILKNRSLKKRISYVLLSWVSPKITFKERYATESFVFAQL
jgi:hypothetical protein